MNLFKQFLDLLPEAPLMIGTVSAVGDGAVTVDLPGGGQMVARGTASIGQRVFFRDGVVEGAAPELDYVELEV